MEICETYGHTKHLQHTNDYCAYIWEPFKTCLRHWKAEQNQLKRVYEFYDYF